MALERDVILRNGVSMPLLGLGTTHNGGYNHDTVVFSLSQCGVKLIDTAKRYGVESFIGQAVADSGADRSDVFLTSKLWPGDYGGLEPTCRALLGSLQRLQTNYLDLFMLHWPHCKDGVNKKACLEETWRSLELMLEADVCRSIGVSNFEESDLEDLLETASVVPHVNQCEFHPLQNPVALRRYCSENRIQFQGYCPLGKGKLLNVPEVLAIAHQMGVSPAQVLIRWSVQNGVVTIPKSNKKDRVWQNSQVLSEEFHLWPEAMSTLDCLHLTRPNQKIIDSARTKANINSDQPDGYKLALAAENNVFPAFVNRNDKCLLQSRNEYLLI